MKINSVFIYDSNNNIVGVYSANPQLSPLQISPLNPISSNTPSPTPIAGNALNVGKEAYFYIMLSGAPLNQGSIYTLHVVTQSGSAFDYEFTP